MYEDIYNVGYSFWNVIIDAAITLFTTSPINANGDVYTITHNLFNALYGISIPLAEVFMLFGMYQDVVGSPKEQQLRRIAMNLLKFATILIVISNLWNLMGWIMELADEITVVLGATGTYQLTMPTEIQTLISQATTFPEIDLESAGLDIALIMEAIFDFLGNIVEYLLWQVLLLIASLASMGVCIITSLSILNSAFQRILKPLIMIPFSTITVSMAAGTSEEGRSTWNYIKMFFGLCLSGAVMVICIKLGVALANGMVGTMITNDITGESMFFQIIFISVKNMLIPVMISGLVKGAESMIARIF